MSLRVPLQIGITGGIGSGKSLVCKLFSVLGTSAYDADSRAKKLMNEDSVLINQIIARFGNGSYENGQLNRSYLSNAVFNNRANLEMLNKLVHPRVAMDYSEWVTKQITKPYVVKEAALLYESGLYLGLDKIILITAPEDIRIKRVLRRDPWRTPTDVAKIIANQMPEEEKIKRADIVIVNNGETMILPQVLKLHHQFSNS